MSTPKLCNTFVVYPKADVGSRSFVVITSTYASS